MNELITALKAAFASEYAFYLKAQNFHWNVEGDDFYQMHQLFGQIYSEVGDSIDAFAENIRKCQSFAPASFLSLNALSVVNGEERTPLDCLTMTQELLQDSDNLCLMFAAVYDKADAAREFGLANFLADRQDAHKKHSWMLRATLVPETEEPGEGDTIEMSIRKRRK